MGLRNLQSANDNLKSKFTGGIAQLVERQLCKLEVRGSNPLASIFIDRTTVRVGQLTTELTTRPKLCADVALESYLIAGRQKLIRS